MKTQITFIGEQASMTHKEIAELVNSRPDNVKVSIERLAERGVIRLPAMQEIEEINNLGLTVKREYYHFEGEQGKRDSIVVVAQLSPEYTAQLVDHWQELETMVQSLGYSESQPAPQPTSANENILSLARVVAEATASATMKAVMEVTTQYTAPAKVIESNATDVRSFFDEVTDYFASKQHPEAEVTTQRENTPPTDIVEYVQVTKIAWETTFSDAACRRLIEFASLPTMKYKGSHGLQVHRESFMDALKALIEESTPPTGKLKRWQHPEFGGFALRKDPKEIFGEAE
ncbi:Rha family transcriptional regulator [Salmonella enterica]|nr:Rha family transcriptional regulator [Salmonella enterica]